MARNIYENAHPKALAEIQSLVEATIAGERIKKEILLERLGTTDGVFAFANLTNVQVQKNYADYDSIWQKFATRTVVSDFRTIQWLDFQNDFSNFKAADKGVTRPPGVLPKVAEGEKYQAFSLSSSLIPGFAVEKFGAQIGFTWESFINDPYNTVRRIPAILSRTAVDVQDANATRALYVAANAAPHLAARPAAGGSGAVSADMALTFDSLEAAITQLKSRVDSHGNPVVIGKLVLNVAPALVPAANRILAWQQVTQRSGTATAFTDVVRSPTFGDIEVVENRFLSFFTGNQTGWILSPAGGDTVTQPAILQAFLAGEEAPEIRVSGLAGYTPNGNALPFTSGSFDTDTFDLRVRVVGGAGAVNSNPLLYSAGTGA